MKIHNILKANLAIGSLSLCGMLTYAAIPEDSELVKITKKRIPQNMKQTLSCRSSPSDSLHGLNELDLFVNDIVIDYRKKNPEGNNYPPGSIFVKTKYYRGEKKPHSRTIMVKKKKKADGTAKPSVTDWEFTSESLPDGKEQKMSKARTQYCMSCHDNFGDHGYVSKRSEHLLRDLLKIRPKEAQPSKIEDQPKK